MARTTPSSRKNPNLGGKVRAIRRSRSLTQVELARRLGISASYLNLIEHNQRPLTAPVLIKLAQEFKVDLDYFASEGEDRTASELMEVFSDPIFEEHSINSAEVRELASTSPGVARAILSLYQSFKGARESAETLAGRMYDEQELGPGDFTRLPSEEVNDFLQRHMNYFAELEDAAAAFSKEAGLVIGGRFAGMVSWLEGKGIEVVVGGVGHAGGVVRRYDAERQQVFISNRLPQSSRTFQLAAQIGLMTQREHLDRLARDAGLSSDPSRVLARVVLANYFAGAVMMPYADFHGAAVAERYDIELLGHRFSTGFEQVCHRLTTLQRPGMEGARMHMIRVDLAGNISKRFSASGIRFARFSGACPRWNVFKAFQTPGRIHIQVSTMPDGQVYFCVARTVPKGRGGYHAPNTVHAVGLGCKFDDARQMIYSDGVDLDTLDAAVPVGVTCRLCDRMDCEQRVLPALGNPLKVDENVRGISFYTPVE